MRKKRILLLPALLACSLLIAPIAARAGTFDGTNMQLNICNSGTTDTSCATNINNFNDGGTGSLSGGGFNVGMWTINSFGAVGSDGGIMLPQLLDLSSLDVTTSGGAGGNALKLVLTITGLTIPVPSISALQSIGGTLDFLGGSVLTSQAWISTTNSAFCVTGCSALTALQTFVGSPSQHAFSGEETGSAGTVNPYSLTYVVTLASDSQGHGSFDGSLDLIPEPATLSVLGSGLLALGTGLRKRLLRA